MSVIRKGNNTIVGTVKLGNPELSDELRRSLTAGEVTWFESWVETRHRTKALRVELAALTLVEAMGQVEKWIEREGGSAAARMAATNIVFRWQALRKLFAKNGLFDWGAYGQDKMQHWKGYAK